MSLVSPLFRFHYNQAELDLNVCPVFAVYFGIDIQELSSYDKRKKKKKKLYHFILFRQYKSWSFPLHHNIPMF